MNTELLRPITTEEVHTYHRDGVLLLKDMFDKDWIELLNKGLDINCESPEPKTDRKKERKKYEKEYLSRLKNNL